jgi:hypothetical protein
MAYWRQGAMTWYEQAEAIRPAGNDSTALEHVRSTNQLEQPAHPRRIRLRTSVGRLMQSGIGRLFPVIALASWMVTSPMAAQQKTTVAPATQQPAKTLKAGISGVILDSLNSGYLSGAEVVIQGAKSVSRTTDSFGKFKADSLEPGTYQVGVFHPLLDTLGVAIATQPFRLGPDSSSYIVLAVPSARTLIHRACPNVGPRAQGSSAVIGHVTDPETLERVSGVDVSIAWTLQ